MKRRCCLILFCLFLGGLWGNAQYYYFDTGGVTYPFKQGCPAHVFVRVTTQSHPFGASAGLLRLRLDPASFSYSTSSFVPDLQSSLFVESSDAFAYSSSPSMSPFWVDGAKTQLQLDRHDGFDLYRGNGGLYGTLFFTPLYSASLYTGVLGIVYDGTTSKTVLAYQGNTIINPAQQYLHMTGVFPILQAPCVSDTIPPVISLSNPGANISQQVSLAGINFSLTDNGGVSSDVPYVWTGGMRTGNLWGIDPSRGVDISTLQVIVAGNGQSRTFNGGMYAVANGKTWEDNAKNYIVAIPGSALFDYGIEKPISLSFSVRDRANVLTTQNIIFNQPQSPTISNRFPSPNTSVVPMDTPVSFSLSDDWAGVDTGTLRVTLSAVSSGGTWGPIVITGRTTISHDLFPSLSTVTVRVQVADNVGNPTDTSWSFQTRPGCADLGCCQDKFLSLKNILSPLIVPSLSVVGGRDPLFWTENDTTGYLDCGLQDDGIEIYRGSEEYSGNAQTLGFYSLDRLQVAGTNILVVLSGNTLFLTKLFTYGSLSELQGGLGGRGSSYYKDSCPAGDFSPSYYDNSCGASHSSAIEIDDSLTRNSDFPDEWKEAYLYAYGKGMIKESPIQNANLTGLAQRFSLARILVEYGVKTMEFFPNTNKEGCDVYTDVSLASEETRFFAKTACQMNLMGVEADGETPKKVFEPWDNLTRAQFGTLLSRLLFGGAYNLEKGDNKPYYYDHLDALKRAGIITNIDPTLLETRIFVLLMLKRAYDAGLTDQHRLLTASLDGVLALEE